MTLHFLDHGERKAGDLLFAHLLEDVAFQGVRLSGGNTCQPEQQEKEGPLNDATLKRPPWLFEGWIVRRCVGRGKAGPLLFGGGVKSPSRKRWFFSVSSVPPRPLC